MQKSDPARGSKALAVGVGVGWNILGVGSYLVLISVFFLLLVCQSHAPVTVTLCPTMVPEAHCP